MIILVLGLGLALVLALAYGAMRATPWSPRDGGALAWARLHGFAAALVAGVAVLATASGVDGLRQAAAPQPPSATGTPGVEALELPAVPLDPGMALLVALAPGAWLLAVYALAQYTWPRATGPVRTARLTPRRATSLLPPVLTGVVAGIAVLTLAAIALAWTAPGVAPLHLRHTTGTSSLEGTSVGLRPGTEVAPWLAVALVTLVAATAAILLVVARRPALTGLRPDEDLAVRRLAVHRALRTAGAAALVVLAVAAAGWADATRQAAEREAHGSLDALAAAYAEGITLDGDGGAHLDLVGPPPPDLPPGPSALAVGTPLAALAGVLVLLRWRPEGPAAVPVVPRRG